MENTIKERPILFSGPMVRALLDGRKTQTRRAVKPQPENGLSYVNGNFILHNKIVDGVHLCDSNAKNIYSHIRCPYGQPGDRLWVRETWGTHKWLNGTPPSAMWSTTPFFYRADNNQPETLDTWRPSIHMPRAASRLLLEITAVRVERVQDISEADAVAEGIEAVGEVFGKPTYRDYIHKNVEFGYPQGSFESLWASINGADSWPMNPWVWVVEFKVIAPSATLEKETAR